MRYDASLIKIKEERVNGKKIKVQVVPPGMTGPNALKINTYVIVNETVEEDEYTCISKNSALLREYNEYIDEGLNPDSDEVIAIKNRIEEDHLFEKEMIKISYE